MPKMLGITTIVTSTCFSIIASWISFHHRVAPKLKFSLMQPSHWPSRHLIAISLSTYVFPLFKFHQLLLSINSKSNFLLACGISHRSMAMSASSQRILTNLTIPLLPFGMLMIMQSNLDAQVGHSIPQPTHGTLEPIKENLG